MPNYLNDLNQIQQEAVKNINGPCLVIAGAGSGKTRVLIYRIAYLLSSGIKANTILALTFTNKAANEMKERISKLVGADNAKYLWMGTFHSIFARILRFEAAHLEYSSNYTIYDTSDSLNLIRTIIKELDLDPETYKANNVLKSISSAKNNLITAAAYANNHQLIERDRKYRKPEIANIYRIYAGRCLKSDAMDFDDLLLNTNLLFRNNTDILTKYQQKFNYILVDEYQDTNFSQYLIVKKLAAIHKNVCVVGDDFQSIYAFRGANIGNILNFKDDYPEYKLYKLEQNYRSTQNIVNAANSVIAKNKNQINKKLFSKNIKGDKIKVIQALTDNEEGYIISNSIIESKIKENYNYNDYAILYRTNAQSRIFEESLRKQSIPYKIYGGLSFYQRKEIKDILAYFRLIINKNDDDALKRIINYPVRGIGKTTINKIESFSREKDTNMWDIIVSLDKYEPALNKRTTNINNFVALLKDFSEKLPTFDAYDLAHYVASKTGILKELSNDKSPENIGKYENIQELLNGIKEFTKKKENEEDNVGLDKYLEDVVLLTNEDYGKKEDKNKVTLLTVHSAKGLEFKNVYIVGVEKDLFPSSFSTATKEDLEEERRLFYVALTRAEKNATISYATSRYRWGKLTNCKPSNFIKEIDVEYLDLSDNDIDNSESNYEDVKPAGYKFKSFTKTVRKAVAHHTTDTQTFTKNDQPLPDTLRPSTLRYGVNYGAAPNPSAGWRKGLLKIETKSGSNFISDAPDKIQVGMQVSHPRFGIGKVISIDGTPPDTKAVVFFRNTGQKKLLLKFAKLNPVK